MKWLTAADAGHKSQGVQSDCIAQMMLWVLAMGIAAGSITCICCLASSREGSTTRELPLKGNSCSVLPAAKHAKRHLITFDDPNIMNSSLVESVVPFA